MKRADRKKVRFASDKQTVSPVKITKGAGIMILAKDTGRVLFLKRSPSSNHPETWDLPGGHTDDAEAPEQTARRETREEIGVNVTGEITQMSDTTNEDVNFVTFYHECRTEFTPKLDLNEHTEYVWAFPSDPPTPLHPGVKLTLDTELAKDANPLSIAAVRLGHKGGLSTSPAKVNAARQNGARHGSDAALAFDKSLPNRSYDVDGRLKVEQSNISRAMVCDYLGSEIPDSELLGLDPNKIYKLFRDPDELAKAAHTFNNIQLLSEHVPVSTVDIQKDLIIGCTGTDTIFEFPFLKNSLCVWTKDGIDRVENKEAQEISCSYRYVADMTPGEFEGTAYDAVMREIHGNHVILTPAGRCGPTVIVGDAAPLSRINQPSKLEKITMSQTLSKKALRVKGVLTAVLQPQFAADKMPNLDIILADVDHKNWLAKKPLILAALKSHMAADADPKPLSGLLDSQDKDAAEDADPIEGILAHCRGKLSDDDLGELESKVRALSPAKKAEDADEDDKKAEDEDDEDKKDEEKDVKEADTVSKKAMDAAIKLAQDATIARINGVHEARKIASPFVGEIALACDSAEDVYRAALKVLNVDVKDIHPSALRTILELQPNPNAKREPVFAGDAAVPAGLDKFLADMGLPA